MQIKQSAVRVAAAATVTVFMAAGVAVPAYATEGTDSTTQSSRQHTNKKGDESTTSEDTSGDETAESDHSDGTAGTSGDSTEPQPESTADETDGGANAGDCEDGTAGSYCSTRDGSDSQNGKGDGEAKGKPCAGCVGKADNKNPKGQYPDGSDRNAGYECDRNQGIGQSNPAHTGCTEGTEETSEVTCPEGATMNVEGECVVPAEETCPEGATMNDAGECVVPAVEGTREGAETPEVLGVEAERSAPQTGTAGANATQAEVAPASGILPDTGAGRYGLPILAGIGLLAAGGVLLARRRPQTGR